MSWRRTPGWVALADQLLDRVGVACPDCGEMFDPFDVRDLGGIPPHEGCEPEETG